MTTRQRGRRSCPEHTTHARNEDGGSRDDAAETAAQLIAFTTTGAAAHLHYDLRRHPKRRADERVVLGHRVRQPRAHPEISKFDVAVSGDHDISALVGQG